MDKTKRPKDLFKDDLTVGEVSKRSGIAVSALHFYEEKGLIASHRTEGNQSRIQRTTTQSHSHTYRMEGYVSMLEENPG